MLDASPLRNADLREILRSDPWFDGLPKPLADLIIKHSIQRDYANDSLIYATGDPPTGQFAVLSGQVRLVANTQRGQLVLYRILKPGFWFGHLAVLDQQPRFQNAIAVGPTTLLHLPMAGYNAIIAIEPRYVTNFAHLICAHIRVAMDTIAEVMTMPLTSRLAHVILNLAEDGPGQVRRARVTQEALAAMTGTTRQTVNRVLRKWEEAGYVRIEYGWVAIRNRRKLVAMADYDGIQFI